MQRRRDPALDPGDSPSIHGGRRARVRLDRQRQALEVARVVRQEFDPVVGDRDGVGMPKASEACGVETWLDGEHHSRLDLRVVTDVEERALVIAEADAMTDVVLPVLPE